MKRRYLRFFVAIYAGAVLTAHVSPVRANTLATTAPRTAHEMPRLLAITDIPFTLAATRGDPASFVPPASSRDAVFAAASPSGPPLAAWVSSTSLSDPALRTRVSELLEQGIAILVTSLPGEIRHERATFGFQSSGRTAIYRQTASGFNVISVTPRVDDPRAAAAWQRAADTAFLAMLPPPRQSAASMPDDSSTDDATGGGIPCVTVSDDGSVSQLRCSARYAMSFR